MPPSAWRLLFLPLILLAFLLVGAPDFSAFAKASADKPALARAIQKAFDSAFAEASADKEPARNPEPAQRRGILVPLYVSFATLQALDAHSTLRALNAGATEANPVMAGVAGRPAALVAMKAGMAASAIYLVEKLRLKSRRTAVILMAALNTAYTTIVAHNYRVGRR
jgi:hypothetical protein